MPQGNSSFKTTKQTYLQLFPLYSDDGELDSGMERKPSLRQIPGSLENFQGFLFLKFSLIEFGIIKIHTLLP